jgi:hypothetical protein
MPRKRKADAADRLEALDNDRKILIYDLNEAREKIKPDTNSGESYWTLAARASKISIQLYDTQTKILAIKCN